MTSRRWDRDRRGRGAAGLGVPGTLGTLLRTTLQQMGVVKDVVERQARSSLSQLDAVMMQRRQREVLARLGEVVWELAQSGELGELAEHGDVATILDELAELEARAHQDGAAGSLDDDDDGTVSAADWAASASRRAGPGAGERGAADRGRRQSELRVWRPNAADIPDPPDEPEADHAPRRHASPATARRDAEPMPSRDPDGPERDRAGAGSRAAPGRGRRSRRRDDGATGGIAFMEDGPVDEDDLGAYMHEDDVPRRR